MLLSAGLGTRLRPLSSWLPKPLLPVGDRPALAHVLGHLEKAGLRRFVVNVHHLAAELEAFAAELDHLAVSREETLLGTAGGVAHAAPLLGEGDVLVWNGDILTDLDVAALLAVHARGWAATLAVRPVALGEGNVGTDDAGRVVRLRRETVLPGETHSYEFLGIHLIGASVRAGLPEQGCLIGDVYLPALREKRATLGVYVQNAPFWDIGTVASYLDANFAWLEARGASSWVAPSAKIAEGVVLKRAIVGGGAEISGRGTLDDVLVWPGARGAAPAHRRVITPYGEATG